jgi:hypothetical protein
LANYIIGFTVPTGLGTNYMISIPASKIKDFNGTAPQSTPDSVMSQISNAGF